MPFNIKSKAFDDNQEIPRPYTGEGLDKSPPLGWEDLPEGTVELALICDDPDAPFPEPWVHWIIYNLSPSLSELPEQLSSQSSLTSPIVAFQGKNSWNKTGYGGPMPPPGHGEHRYFFKLYALNKPLKLEPAASKQELLKSMEGHILGWTQLMGKYQR